MEIATCEYTTEQELMLTLVSSVDTCLYIIDPRSTSLLVEITYDDSDTTKYIDNLFNDDYGSSTDSQITKVFDPNTPYLLIFSAYDPSFSDSTGWFDLFFD